MVRYNLLPHAGEYEHKQNDDGRLIVAEFPELLYIQAYVPQVGVNDRAKVIRWRAPGIRWFMSFLQTVLVLSRMPMKVILIFCIAMKSCLLIDINSPTVTSILL